MNLNKIYNFLSRSSFFINLISVGASSALTKLISLIIIGYPARILGPINFGLFGFGTSMVAYAGIMLIPGITSWGTREIARDKDKAGEMLVTISLIRISLAIITYLILLLYVFYIIDSPKQRIIVLLCGISIFSSAFTIDWVFNGLELMRIPAFVTVFTSLINVLGLFTLIKTPDDIYKYALFAPTLTFLNVFGCYFFLIKRNLKLTIPPIKTFKKAIKAALPLGITMSLVIVLHYANNFIVNFHLGPEALGIFMASFFLIELAATLPNILGSVFLSRLSRNAVGYKDLAKRDAAIYAQVHMILGFFIAAICFIEAPSIISILYGNKYFLSIDLLRYMSVAIIFNYAIFSYTNCLISFGYDRVMLFVVLVSAIISVGGGLLLVPKLGVKGASIIVIFIDLCGWLVSLPYYKKFVGSFHFNLWLIPAFGAITIIFIALGLQIFAFPFWIRILLCTICYVCFIYKDVNKTIQRHIL